VNTGSVGSLIGNYGIADYIGGKHGVVGLTKAAALEYAASNIRVNAIAPGATRTDMIARWFAAEPQTEGRLNAMTPMGRMARPEEIAEAALWLLSDSASYVTGVTLPVDGGYVVP